MKKVLLVLTVFSVLSVLPITATGCKETEYINTDYGYTISYPAGWTVKSTDTSDVIIFKPDSFVQLSILADSEILPLRTRVDSFIDIVVWMRNGELLHSAKPELKWDWVLRYQYFNEGRRFQAQAYFLETSNCSYVIFWDAPGDNELYKTCQDIALTFSLR